MGELKKAFGVRISLWKYILIFHTGHKVLVWFSQGFSQTLCQQAV